MKKITITLALLLTTTFSPSEANATEIPSEVREAFRSIKLPEVEAFKAVERAVAKAGKALEGLVPVPDLTVDLRGRRLSKHLLGSSWGARGNFNLKADYTLGGTPVAKLAIRIQKTSLQASYAADGNLYTAISYPTGKHHNLQYAISSTDRTHHRISWNFSLPL
ncbi:MAG: hypothetical protein COB53_02340 [Elusimicrobia bacterium]|nr:MAG: hypothetical protein COB53_02340 [Elusimicrobiota bacterium]